MIKLLSFIIMLMVSAQSVTAQELSDVTGAELKSIWNGLDPATFIKKTYKDKHLVYVWANQLHKKKSVITSKVFLIFTDKFKKQFEIRSKFATALLIKSQGKEFVLDKMRANGPVTIEQWRDLVTKGEKVKLEKLRISLVHDLRQTQEKLADVRSYGTWVWRDSVAKLEAKVDALYQKLDSLLVNEYETAKFDCKLISSIDKMESQKDKSWCFMQKTDMYHFGMDDLTAQAAGMGPTEWDENQLRWSRFSVLEE